MLAFDFDQNRYSELWVKNFLKTNRPHFGKQSKCRGKPAVISLQKTPKHPELLKKYKANRRIRLHFFHSNYLRL